MVLRVISGVLIPRPDKRDGGQAVITFETNTVVGDAGQSDSRGNWSSWSL